MKRYLAALFVAVVFATLAYAGNFFDITSTASTAKTKVYVQEQ